MSSSLSEKQSKINFICNSLLFLSSVSFLFFYLILSYFNRPAFDDFIGIYFAEGKSIFQYVSEMYLTISGRWISWAYMYSVISSASSFQGMYTYFFIYYIFTLAILIYSFNQIIQAFFVRLFNISISFKISLVYSVLFLACFYFFTFQNIETWWYIGASFMYLQGIVFLLLGIALLLRKKKTFIHYFLIVFSFIYAGSCYEVYSLIICFLFVSLIIYFLLKNKKNWKSLREHWFFKGFLIAFISMSASSLICVFAKSNLDRSNDYKFDLARKSLGSDWSVILNFLGENKLAVAILLAMVWFIVGINIKNHTLSNRNNELIKATFKFSLFTLFSSVLITYLFQKLFLYDCLIPSRGWAFTSIALAFFCCFSFLLIGYFFSINIILQNAIKVLIPVIVFTVLTYNLINQYKITNVYSEKYDALIDSFLDAKKNNNRETFYMEKLPDSGMLMQLDMEDDSHDPIFLKNILGLDFEIKVKQ